jgi:ribonucleotide reductase beta subunit family protein with ferritin-like domain
MDYVLDINDDTYLADMIAMFVKTIWKAEDIQRELQTDIKNYSIIDSEVKKLIKLVSIVFLFLDGALDNEMIQKLEFKGMPGAWFKCKEVSETIHKMTYTLLAKQFLCEPNYGYKTLNEAAYSSFSKIKVLIDWMKDHADLSVAENMFAQTIVESLFFQTEFAQLFWLEESYPNMFPGLLKANELISRDEAIHAKVNIYIGKTYSHVSYEQAKALIVSAVDAKSKMLYDAIDYQLNGMNAELLIQYLKYIADYIMVEYGFNGIYNVKNPFGFMIKQSIGDRVTDFFTHNPSEYQKESHTVDLVDMYSGLV